MLNFIFMYLNNYLYIYVHTYTHKWHFKGVSCSLYREKAGLQRHIWYLLSCLLSSLPSNEKLLLALKKFLNQSIYRRTGCTNHQHSYSTCKTEMNAYCRQKGTKVLSVCSCNSVVNYLKISNYILNILNISLNKKKNPNIQNRSPFVIKCIILPYSKIPRWHFGVKLEIILFITNSFSCFVNTEKNC